MKALILFHTCPRKTKSNHARSYFIGFNPYRSFHHMQMSIIEKYGQFYCLRKRKVMKVETKNRNYIANKGKYQSAPFHMNALNLFKILQNLLY